MPKSAAPPTLPLAADRVLEWYDRNGRALPWRVPPALRRAGIAPDPYFVWLSEVMLQQTTITAVRSYFARFTALWPSVEDLAAAPLEDVLVEWAGLGYYARARNLHACAREIVARYAGRFPTSSAELLTLPGIGAYTAAAIAAITVDEPVGVLDGNVERLLARYLTLPVPPRDAKVRMREVLAQSVPDRSGDFAQAMMDLGATICAPRAALCLLCPLQPGCAGHATGAPLDFPVRAPKPIRPVRYGHAYVYRRPDGAIFLRARGPRGLLARMTETPGSEWMDDRIDPVFPAPSGWRNAGTVIHVFTHFRLELEVWTATISNADGLGEGWWADPHHLRGEALPSLFRKVIKATNAEDRPTKESRRSLDRRL